MRRLIPIIVLVLACVVPTAAQANYSDSPPHLSCGEIDGTFSDFPSGPQTVTLHTAVGGVPQPDQNITANGPDFTTSTGYWNPDAGSHVVQGWFTWTTSQGETGRGPLQTTTITNCPPQAPPVTIVQQTTTAIKPDEGHVHLYVNNVLVSMNYGLEQDIPVQPGSLVLKAEFVASDHAPFNPRVWSPEVIFTVKA